MRGDGKGIAFIRQALASDTDECILWPYSQNRGYGNLCWRGVFWLAHRLVCHEAHGPPPAERLDAAHYCGNRLCVNPSHVRWATRTENNADKQVHGTQSTCEDHPKAKLTWPQVREIRALRGTIPNRAIGRRFGVSHGVIARILNGQIWRESSFDREALRIASE